MKKNCKRIFVLLLVLAQIFVLCGCDALDEMRKNQAFINEDGTILWQGNTYKELPWNEYLTPNINYETAIYLTEPDVPVLISNMMVSMTLSASNDRNFLTSYYAAETQYYCIDTMYDELCARLSSPFEPEKICYRYDVYNEETNSFDLQYYTLTQEQVEAVQLVTETVEPLVLSDGMYLDVRYQIFLQECSDDLLLQRNTIDIAVTEQSYYLYLYTQEGTVTFLVPEGCNAIFDEITKAYLSEVDYLDFYDKIPADLDI